MTTISPRFQPQVQPYRRVGLFCLLLVLLIIGLKFWMWYVPNTRLLTVQSGSMQPYLHKGDAIVVQPLGDKDVQVGDIISYHSPVSDQVIITHRVQSYNPQTGRVVTKGDSVTISDQPFSRGLVVGRLVQRWQRAGSVVDILHGPFGLILFYGVTIGLIVKEARRLTAYFKPVYRWIGYID